MKPYVGLFCLLALLLGGQELGHTQQPAPNRDPHGPQNVGDYIQRLLSPERVAMLKPDEVIATLALPEDAAVADLGCGPGVFTVPLAKQLKRGIVFAVDVEPRQLDALRIRLLEQNLNNVIPVLASFSTPHLPPAHLDLILIVDTYHHLGDRINYFRQLREVLAPGGRLAILEYKPGDLPIGPPAEQKLPKGQMQEELQAAGWGLLRRYDTHRYHDFELWVPSTSF